MENIELIKLDNKNAKSDISFLNSNAINKVFNFHKSFPIYSATPLVELKNTAKYFGVDNIYVKDESYRFGLNAFKVLGGSYAIGNFLAHKLNKDISELSFDKLISPEIRKKLGNITFVTATDGNHGRGVAWTANQLKHKSIVFMPKGSSLERLNNIKAENAEAEITEFNYDDAVRYANDIANKKGYVMVQDTAWEGYEKIPMWIMQGYATMGLEIINQLKEKPTHVFLQAGVGSMSGAITGLFANHYLEDKPIITIVEPNKADCIFRTVKANDGKLHNVKGEMNTIMAGLACGEPCTIGYEVLKAYAENYISAPDYVAAKGMRILANPIGDDHKIISGESGAASFGCIAEILLNKKYADLKKKLGIDNYSKLLFISTEGDTDKANYLATVWDGKDNSYNK